MFICEKRRKMSKLYLVPDIKDMERMSSLADTYDCAFEYNDFFNPNIMDNPARQEDIIACYGGYRNSFGQDTIHGAFLDVTIHSSDPLIRDVSEKRVHQSMEIADRMGVRGVVFHTGRIFGFRDREYLDNWQEANAAFFSELAVKYPRQQIFMENMFDEAPDVLAGLAERMRGVENFGICLDYAHAAISGCPVKEWIETLAPYIRHMHINDNDLKNDRHWPVDSGQIDWHEYDTLVRKHRINASVLVEVNGYEAQVTSLQYMRQNGIYPMERKE